MKDGTDEKHGFFGLQVHRDRERRSGTEPRWTFAELDVDDATKQANGKAEPVSRVVAPDLWERDMDWHQDFRYVSREQLFVQKAKELETAVAETAEFVPFQTYWPTYEEMQPRQLKWYLYWRNEVRSGRYPDTDLSYLFIYLYELIHGVGWSEPAEGYTLMERVWQGYRQRYPKLDLYVREWLYDLALVFDLEMPPAEPMAKLPRNLSMELKELEWRRRFTADPLDVSWELLLTLIDYDVEKSRFYLEQGRKELRNYVPKVVSLVDGYLLKSKGSRILELHKPMEQKVSRFLFRSAVYDHDLYGRTKPVSILPYSGHPPLRAFLTQLVRLTENKLREQLGYKGKLRGIDVGPEIEQLVDRFLSKEFDRRKAEEAKARIPKVKINATKLRKLQQESDEVRDMLLSEEQTLAFAPEAPGLPPEKVASSPKISVAEPLQPTFDFERGYEQVPEEVLLPPIEERRETLETKGEASVTLSEEWQELFASLTAPQAQMLAALFQGQSAAERQMIAEQIGSMPELLVDEINELAMERIGDLLVDGDEILEDYRVELGKWLITGR
ncbi:TerB N-terminal domain-containing protein [Paenibacillus sp. DXFW5]|uniref:TerB N-terminal domain-containing protein n=1 Tax=Paenibacillus rhizolycopersici TaxID=2780073 RepID=A0ABS2H1E6_9BACL|nr:TerB N-terminal domain-containing protein [Paenibacillus rhizolycopersici]MBM6995210.1 TerB N-terminal domain-containing protein [Paenibacillus rhizolycopersici]